MELQTRIVLLLHKREAKKTTNTGQLALKALVNSSVYIHGEQDAPMDLSSELSRSYTPLVLIPGRDSIPLTQAFLELEQKPLLLFVPDGNWRQASKIPNRHPHLQSIRRVYLPEINTSTHHLRKESSPIGRSTLEAIAMALEIIEGEAPIKALRNLYLLKRDRTLAARGIKIRTL